jgi:hypothetical protein
MTPTPLTLRGRLVTDSRTATVAILEIALQASLESLGTRHTELRQDGPTIPTYCAAYHDDFDF